MNIQHHPHEDAFQAAEPILLGITGLRNVGKTTTANHLVDEYDFTKTHPFEGGKVAAQAFFEHVTGSAYLANEMVNGRLKDKPSEFLPDNATPRSYLEKTGQFAGVELGVKWTLGLEVERAKRLNPGLPIVVESVVYEIKWFREQGGKILRLERPDFDNPKGESSDDFQAMIKEDYKISATTTVELLDKVDDLMETLGVV